MATLHMLTESSPSQKMGFVIQTAGLHTIVIDGGTRADGDDLLRYLQTVTGESVPTVDLWILTHCHTDHIGALCEILEKHPNAVRIRALAHRLLSAEFVSSLSQSTDSDLPIARAWADGLLSAPEIVSTVTVSSGDAWKMDDCTFHILRVTEEEFSEDAANNSSMLIRLDTSATRVLFTGDLGVKASEQCLARYRGTGELRADLCQMAHHGQNGATKAFYTEVGMRACLWCTPLWLWNNDAGLGYNTHVWKTVEVRGWMDELGVTEHYNTFDGTKVIPI